MRRCTRCQFVGEDSQFGVRIKSKLNATGICKRCKAAYNARWYANNKASHHGNVQRNNTRYVQQISERIAALKSAPCTDCGRVFPPCAMDFDHLGLQKKIANVAEMCRRKNAFTKILAEIAKCELVCAVCHRIRTHERRTHKPP